MSLSSDYQLNCRPIHSCFSGGSPPRIQSAAGIIWEWEWKGWGADNRVGKIFWRSLTKIAPPITVFNENLICWRSTTVLNIKNHHIIGQMLPCNFDRFPDVCSIAQRTFQCHVADDSNIGSQLTLGGFDCVVGRTFRFIGEAMSLDIRASSGIAKSIGSFNRAFHVSGSRLHLGPLATVTARA